MGSERRGLALILAATTACAGSRTTLHFSDATVVSAPTSVGTSPMVAVSAAGAMASAWVSAPDGGIDGRLYVTVNDAPAIEIRDSIGPVEGKGESPPKLAFGADGSLNAIYVVDKDDPSLRAPLEALRFVRSRDGGATWSTPVSVSSDATFGQHNFHALHVAGNGTMYVSWLGGEAGKLTPWIAHSSDGGATWSPQVQVDSGATCDCCRTGVATATDGTVYMVWRHVFDGNMRDVVVARSSDTGTTWSSPVRVHADGWSFNGCPRAGPSLQVDSAGRVHVGWWTGKAKGAGVWYAQSSDGARTFSEPLPLGVADASRPAHIQLALGTAGIVAAIWDDGTHPETRITFRLSRDGGTTFGAPQVLSTAGHNPGYPVLAFHGERVTTLWAESRGPASPMPAMLATKDPTAHRGIKPIGNAQVLVREAALPR